MKYLRICGMSVSNESGTMNRRSGPTGFGAAYMLIEYRGGRKKLRERMETPVSAGGLFKW